MTTQEIFKLLDAGYTKDEIAALEAQPQPEPAPAPQPEPAPAPQPEPKPESWAEVEKKIADMIRPMQENLDKTLKAIQAANVKGAVGGKTESVTVESVVADFFGKPQKGGK